MILTRQMTGSKGGLTQKTAATKKVETAMTDEDGAYQDWIDSEYQKWFDAEYDKGYAAFYRDEHLSATANEAFSDGWLDAEDELLSC
jgi:hypothetical protein